MDKNKYLNLAIDTVIGYAAEQGIKYRRGDFIRSENEFYLPQNIATFCEGKFIVILKFDFERCGNRIRTYKDMFLNYINARVHKDGIFFSFSTSELDLIDIKNGTETGAGNIDNEKIEKIIQRISKLFELANLEKNPSEAEAIAAIMKAQELLAKYNLDVTDVTGETKKEDIEKAIADIGTGNKWKYALADTVGRSYCCRTYYLGAEQIIFYGYKSDVIIARRVFVYLFNVGKKLANYFVKEYRQRNGSADGIYNSFCAGFIRGVDNELSRNCTALMLVVPQEVNKSFDILSEGFKSINTHIDVLDATSYERGKTEGKRALNAQYIEAH